MIIMHHLWKYAPRLDPPESQEFHVRQEEVVPTPCEVGSPLASTPPFLLLVVPSRILNHLQPQLNTSQSWYISPPLLGQHCSDKQPLWQDPSPVQLDPSSGCAATRHCLAPPQNRERDLKEIGENVNTWNIPHTKFAS